MCTGSDIARIAGQALFRHRIYRPSTSLTSILKSFYCNIISMYMLGNLSASISYPKSCSSARVLSKFRCCRTFYLPSEAHSHAHHHRPKIDLISKQAFSPVQTLRPYSMSANKNGDSQKKSYHKKATGTALKTAEAHLDENDLKLYGSCFWYACRKSST